MINLSQINFISVFIVFLITLLMGGIFGFFFFILGQRKVIAWAKEEAEDPLSDAKEIIELQNLEEKERVQEIETEIWTQVESEMLKFEERIENLQEKMDEKKEHYEKIQSETKQKYLDLEKSIQIQERSLQSGNDTLNNKRKILKDLTNELKVKIAHRLQVSLEKIKNDLTQEWVENNTKRIQTICEEFVDSTKEHAEQKAKRIMSIALSRFARAYCPERGIGAVVFPDQETRKRFCDAEGKNIKSVEAFCGCDLIIEDEMDMVGVAGFDPVRRELTRRTLEKLFKQKKPITPETIKRIAELQKNELLKNIRSDGDLIAKELKLDGFHPEVKQMMGALRYRYSFTQNQYFHIGEVGWLAGLMASELNIDIRKARRCGVLHDIGKSMDHAQEGGHAVIGANFIQTRGEAEDVIHAVRAHHYDVTPENELDYLVIAADAISGARPGARRSTIESYNQKVSELQDIARSFEGVTDCFVLSGGRECRVMVNGKKIDDTRSLDLAKKIAEKIEEDCQYPGQIKVVVVRETFATENTTGKNH